MKVEIKGKVTDFDVKAVGKLSGKEFEKFCLTLSTFKQLEPKERDAKIKEVYGNLKANVEQISKLGSGPDIHSNDEQSNRGDIGAEQSANGRGKDIGRKEDKAKVPKQAVRSEKKETKR